MTASKAYEAPCAEPSDLKGMRILLVEDSWHLAKAMKNLLQALGAKVAGPVATSSEAEHLIAEHTPDAALVDFNLRGGELANNLIDLLHDRGVRVIVTTGYTLLPLAPGKVAGVLQKPIRAADLLAALRPMIE